MTEVMIGDNIAKAEAAECKAALAEILTTGKVHIDAWLRYGTALNRGRELFASDPQFGQWVDKNLLYQVGTVEIQKNERSAAMWGAANPKDLAAMQLAHPGATTLRGWHTKWLASQKPTPAKEKTARPTDRKTVATSIIDGAGGAGISLKDLRAELEERGSVEPGMDQNVVKQVATSLILDDEVVVDKGVYRAKHYSTPLPDLTETEKAKVDAVVQRREKELAGTFDKRVQERVQSYMAETLLPHWQKKITSLTNLLKARKGVMTKKEHKSVLAALHPDANLSPEKRTEIFAMFSGKEVQLTDGKSNPSPTLADLDLDAMKENMRQANARARAASKRAKKPA